MRSLCSLLGFLGNYAVATAIPRQGPGSSSDKRNTRSAEAMKRINQLVDAFSRTPAFPKGGAPKLIAITFSHYCEKARWALDLSPLASSYVEDCHAPSMTYRPVKRALQAAAKARGESWNPEGMVSTTPLLVYEDGRTYHDSSLILEHLAHTYPQQLGHLYPNSDTHKLKEVTSVVADLDKRLGVSSRALAYYYALQQYHKDEGLPKDEALAKHMGRAFGRHSPVIETLLAHRVFAFIGPRMAKWFKLSKATHDEHLRICREVFADMSRRLQDKTHGPGAVYLCGTDRMSAADLTFAALAFPLLFPPQCPNFFTPLSSLPLPYQQLVHEFRDTPAGQHALRLYQTERYPGEVSRPVTIRVAPGRNRLLPAALLATCTVAALAGVAEILQLRAML